MNLIVFLNTIRKGMKTLFKDILTYFTYLIVWINRLDQH